MGFAISSWSIRNPIPPIVLFLLLSIAGVYSYRQMPVTNLPDLTLPMITVTVAQHGASPEELEKRITRRVEDAVMDIRHIKHVRSSIEGGVSSTILEFHTDVDIDRAFNDVRNAITNIRPFLPQNIAEPLVQQVDVNNAAIAMYTVLATGKSLKEISGYIDNELSRSLLSLPGVAKVSRVGGIDQEITVALDSASMAAFGVSPLDISRQLALVQENAPGGRMIAGDREFSMRTIAGADTLEDLRRTAIPLPSGSYVQLGDIAEISSEGTTSRTISRLDGVPSVSFSVFRNKDASELDVVKEVDRHLREISEKSHADGQMVFQQIFSIATYTAENFDTTWHAVLEGAFLTVLIIFLFLRDIRSTLIASVIIPLSIIPSFAVMHALGFNLNMISLLGIALVIGVLVDDAIVEVENIHRHMAMGISPYKASIVATEEIGLTVIATTVVICAVFMPVSFMPGIGGQVFRQFGLTVSLTAFFSLLVARLIVPLLCAYLLRSHGKKEKNRAAKKSAAVFSLYLRIVRWTLGHRLATCGLALLVLVISAGMLPFLTTGFLPNEEYSRSNMKLELPRGDTLERTDAIATQISRKLREYPDVQYVLATVNGGALGAEGVHQASVEIQLRPPGERSRSRKEFEAAVLQDLRDIPDIHVNFNRIEGEKDVSIALRSRDADALFRAARQIEREMRGVSGLSAVSNSSGHMQPEIIVRPKNIQAAQLGVTTRQISNAVTVATMGDYDFELSNVYFGGISMPVRVQLAQNRPMNLNALHTLSLFTGKGEVVPLSAVADFEVGYGPASITRYDRERTVFLEANLNGISLGEAMESIRALPSVRDLPDAVSLEYTGDVEAMEEMASDFIVVMGAGLLLVYLVQVLLYKDWIQPVTRMAALPLSIGGAFIMLLLTGMELNLFATIGILMLMGIADKNSILLVDYILEAIRKGHPEKDAILQACQVRARPIIMTSLAMLAGMLPIAIGLNEASAFRRPMAVAVIGGIISSTMLSLIFVPVMFSCVYNFEQRVLSKVTRFISPNKS